MPLWFGAALAAISRFIGTRIGQWVLAALLFFGIQFTASKFVVAPLLDQIMSAFTGAPASIVEWLAYLNVDKYVTMILSAYASVAATGALKMTRRPAA